MSANIRISKTLRIAIDLFKEKYEYVYDNNIIKSDSVIINEIVLYWLTSNYSDYELEYYGLNLNTKPVEVQVHGICDDPYCSNCIIDLNENTQPKICPNCKAKLDWTNYNEHFKDT